MKKKILIWIQIHFIISDEVLYIEFIYLFLIQITRDKDFAKEISNSLGLEGFILIFLFFYWYIKKKVLIWNLKLQVL